MSRRQLWTELVAGATPEDAKERVAVPEEAVDQEAVDPTAVDQEAAR